MSVAEPGATDGFVTLRAASCFVQTEVRFESVVRELGLLEPGGLAGLVARGGGPSGRTGNVILELDALDVRLHVRPLRHGGWLATLPGKRLFRIARPLEELRVHRALRNRGAPVPAPAFVVAERGLGPWWIAAFATVHEERAPDAAAFLAARPARERVEAAAAAAWLFTASDIAGGPHADGPRPGRARHRHPRCRAQSRARAHRHREPRSAES